MSRVILLLGCALGMQAQMLVPASTFVTIGHAQYRLVLTHQMVAPNHGVDSLRLYRAAAASLCGNGDLPGEIRINAGLLPVQQAKAMIHETVHIAQTCDLRDLPVDERIAQDISDLLNSSEGGFVLKELK